MQNIEMTRLRDPLGRYYTPYELGRALAESMSILDPKRVLDLGAGTGSLSYAASLKWTDAKIFSVDVDGASKADRYRLHLNQKDGHKFSYHSTDALEQNLHETLGLRLGDIDASVCNPPYIKSTWREAYRSILEEAGFTNVLKRMKEASSEVLFLAQKLRLLKNKGQLGLIVPDGIIAGEKCQKLRRFLIENHDIKHVCTIAKGVFQ